MIDETATNPGADEDVRVEDQAGVETEAEEAAGDEAETDESEASDEDQPDDSEEIEHEGQKHRIPKALKPLLMMQADYTKKTQEVAESRKALESRQAEINQRAESIEALKEDHFKVSRLESTKAALTTQRDQYLNVDWAGLQAQDPDAYEMHRGNQRAVRDALADAEEGLAAAQGSLKAKETARQEAASQATVTDFQSTMRALADPEKGIKGWSPELINQTETFAKKEFGLTTEELLTSDERAWRVLHRLRTAEEQLKKTTTAKRHETAQQVQPAIRTKGNFAPAGLHDKLPIDEWMRRNAALEAKKRKG